MTQLIFTFYLGFQSHATWQESVLIYNQATKFWSNGWAVTPSFPCLLSNVNDPLLPYLHYIFLDSIFFLLNVSSSVPAKLL